VARASAGHTHQGGFVQLDGLGQERRCGLEALGPAPAPPIGGPCDWLRPKQPAIAQNIFPRPTRSPSSTTAGKQTDNLPTPPPRPTPARVGQRALQRGAVDRRRRDAREEVAHDAGKQRQVVGQELTGFCGVGLGSSGVVGPQDELSCRVHHTAIVTQTVSAGLQLPKGTPRLGPRAQSRNATRRALGTLTSRMARSTRTSSSSAGRERLRLPAAVMTLLTARMPWVPGWAPKGIRVLGGRMQLKSRLAAADGV
jgi:hypothetical protein